MERVIAVQARDGFRLWLRFTDGSEGEVDLSHLVGRGVFAAWADPDLFGRVTVDRDAGTVCWPGGIDLDPDVLYSKLTGKPLPGEEAAPPEPLTERSPPVCSPLWIVRLPSRSGRGRRGS